MAPDEIAGKAGKANVLPADAPDDGHQAAALFDLFEAARRSGERIAPAFFVADAPGSQDGSLASWCAWCECVHIYGAAGRGARPRIERRGAHCENDSGSPFAGRGIDLMVIGAVPRAADAMPDAPMTIAAKAESGRDAKRHRLGESIDRLAGFVRSKLLAAILGRRGIDVRGATFVVGTSRVYLERSAARWRIETGGKATDGAGVVSLAATLYGVPEPVVARRMFEAATGMRLVGDDALAFEDCVARLFKPPAEAAAFARRQAVSRI